MRSGTWGRLCGVLALALIALPARLMATTANDLCAAAANPCTVSTPVTVSAGSTIDVGTRELRIAAGGALDVGSGTMTLMAARLTIDSGGFVRALGTSTDPGGTITVQVGDVTNAGTIDASGTPGGSISITATGTVSATGPITARALSRADPGGNIKLVAASATLSAALSVVGGFDAVGGDITVDTTGDLSVSGTLDVSGGDGGGLDIQAGQAGSPGGGNLTLSDTSVLRADATTAGGFGGTVDVTAVGDGVATGNATLNGLASSIGLAGSLDIGGGSGGCIDVQATGNIHVERSSAKMTVEGGPPDGDGGEVDITSDAGSVVLMGSATASVAGDQSSGGGVAINSAGDITVGGSILSNGGDGGGGDTTVSSSTASVSIARSGVIDVSSTAAGQGGGICLNSGTLNGGPHSILVEGRLSADGGTGGGAGGAIDLQGGDSVRVAATGSMHAAGSGGGAGGTLTLHANPGIALVEGRLLASGGSANGPGGIIAVEARGRINVAASVDARGGGAGGQIGFATDIGPVDILNNVTASSSAAAGGSIEVTAQGMVRIASSLVSDGNVASASGTRVEIIGCTVIVCGRDSPNCSGGGVGVLSSLGPSGVNRITGRDAAAILGTMRASQSNGRNELVSDGQAAHEPLVLGQVTPPATLITDASILPCPRCGNHVIEPPETCDDGNTLDGDGCSSSCQVEAVVPGDANGDHVLRPDDLGFTIEEIFDGDGDSITMVSGGAFPGSPGVDSNGDTHVTAADLTATIKLLAGGR